MRTVPAGPAASVEWISAPWREWLPRACVAALFVAVPWAVSLAILGWVGLSLVASRYYLPVVLLAWTNLFTGALAGSFVLQGRSAVRRLGVPAAGVVLGSGPFKLVRPGGDVNEVTRTGVYRRGRRARLRRRAPRW